MREPIGKRTQKHALARLAGWTLLIVAVVAAGVFLLKQPGEPVLDVAADKKRPEVQSPKERAAPSAALRAKFQWRVAPGAKVRASRIALLGKGTLKEITSQVDEPVEDSEATRPERAEASMRGKKSRAVLQGEPLPLEHRRMIRRYFESIRPKEDVPVKSP